jgi:hypothetical protein
MSDEQNGKAQRAPQLGDIVLYGRSTDGKGDVSEVPAIILEVQLAGNVSSRVDLKTFEMGHEMESRRGVEFAAAPRQGHWRWRPDR